MLFLFILTLTFDLYVKLTGKGQHFDLKWFDGLTMLGSKVVGVFNKLKKLSGAITARRGPRALLV